MRKQEILQSIQLRQSTLKDYLNCPLMFRFRHLDKVPPEHRNPAALHGSVLHQLLYMIHEEKWNMNVSHYYRDAFETYEHANGAESSIPLKWKDRDKELSAFEANAIEILDNYRKKEYNREAIILYAECKFRVKIVGHIFTGTIDQVRRNTDNTTEMLDFKSGKQQPSEMALHNDWQLSLYLYALKYGKLLVGDEWIKPNLHPDYCSIYFLRAHEIRKRTTSNGKIGEEKGEPLLRTIRGSIELRAFRAQIRNLLKSMLKDWHYPNPNHCYICSYAEHCKNHNNELPRRTITKARQRLKDLQIT